MKNQLLIIISILLTLSVFAQNDIKFHTLTPKGGLSYDGIIDIEQDEEGFMWFMLADNIFRFDGYNYKSYKLNFLEENKTLNNSFYNFAKDSQQNLYVSTRFGLYKFGPVENKFNKISEQSSSAVYIDSKDLIWINSDSTGFINSDNELFFPKFENRRLPLKKDVYCENGDDLYLFSYYGGIYRYNRNKQQIDDCNNINDLFEDASLIDAKIYEGELWMITSKFTLFKIDLTNCTVSETERFPELSGYRISALHIAENGDLWIATNNGIYIYNPKTKTITNYQNNQNNQFSIPHNSVWTIAGDNKNNIWVGTYMGSVAYVNFNDISIFESHYLSVNGLNKVPVSGFTEFDNKIWISTEGGGVNIFNPNTDNFEYLEQKSDKNSLSSNYTKSMFPDNSGNIWIATFRGGLNRYNPKNKQFTHLRRFASNNKTTLISDNLRKILQDANQGIWIIYLEHTGAFSYYSYDEQIFTHFNLSDELQYDMSNNYIYDLASGRNNKLWFLTSYSLIGFDISTEEFEHIPLKSPGKSVASTLCSDDLGQLWIGTYGNELIKYNPAERSFEYLNDIFKTEDTEIYSINYTKGKVWMGTTHGLYAYDPQTEVCKVFNESDGTQGDVYYPLATFKSESGNLYFGGTGGFTIVRSDEIGYNNVKPEIIISDIYIDNKTVFNHSEIGAKLDFKNQSPLFKLNHKQQNFGFEISSDSYLNTDKNQFRYRLKNYDDRWITTDAHNRTIQYTKIPSGKYYFQAQAANNDGVWGDILSLQIIRKIEPWLSIPALLFYFLLLASIVKWFVISYRNQKRLELKLYRESLEKEKNEEIHSSQLKFLTNISHDLKTPLTLIMATINRMREEGLKEYYYKVLNSNSERLLNLLNDLLDFRKVSSKNMKLNVSSGNLNEFIKKVSSEFHQYANEKSISFNIDLEEPEMSSLFFDKQVMEKILLNLLNNAFKYSSKGGNVIVEAGSAPYHSVYKNSFSIGDDYDTANSDPFYITIRDNGVGISKESIDKVFDRYYRVKTNRLDKHLGTGIGLALVKELVLLHKGMITIYSERDTGTDFILRFSGAKDFYSYDEISELEEPESEINLISEDDDSSVIETTGFEEMIHNEYRSSDKEKTILIAEDNVDLRTLIKSSLTEDYNIIGFNNGKEAFEYLKKKDADLIISDIMMPEMDGITFCNSVKSNVETSHIPFVLLTAKTGIESRLEGSESGADLYFEKPIDLTLLKLSISNIFKQQDVLREHYAKNYFADVSEITTNKEDNDFLNEIVDVISKHLSDPQLDVNFLAQKMKMSRSKLYSKLKTLTGKSVVEFILSNRLRHAAKLLIENDINIQEAMFEVGIGSQSYFATAFKKEFGLPPSKFVAKYKEDRGK